jgi:hypothetical protein
MSDPNDMVDAFMQFCSMRGNHAVWLGSGVVPLGPKRFLFLVRRSTELASQAALRWNDMNAASSLTNRSDRATRRASAGRGSMVEEEHYDFIVTQSRQRHRR